MGLFDKQTKPIPRFAYRSEAFDYYFAKLIEEGRDEMSAAEQADKFANIVATNKRLPDTPPPPMNAIEKGVSYAKQIVAIKQDNPELWDLATSVLGGIIGGFAGGTTAVAIQEPTTENIDFNNLP
jgi:hypothetical protein